MNKLLFTFILTTVFLFIPNPRSPRKAPPVKGELEYCREIAAEMTGATLEYHTPDGSRVDILTAEVAFEVDYAPKYAEGIGQSLFYGLATNRRPGLILLIKDFESERRFYLRALAVCSKYDIVLQTKKIP